MSHRTQVSPPEPAELQNTSEEVEVLLPLRLQDTGTEPRHVRSAEAFFPDPADAPKPTRPRPKAPSLPKVTGPAVVGKTLWALFCVLAFSILAYFLFSRFVITAVVIQGRSMQPTLQDGERYYLNRLRYLFVAPKRGDVVVLKDPGHKDYAVKRIVAGPNDCVKLRDGGLFLNGKRLAEPYLPDGTRTSAPDRRERLILLGPDQYYVLGDNRSNSEDSRFYGTVKRKHIVGALVK